MSQKPAESLSDLRRALQFWEVGRWVYNVILLGLGLLWSWNLRNTMIDQALLGYWGSVAAFGVTANVFYTLGLELASEFSFIKHGAGSGGVCSG